MRKALSVTLIFLLAACNEARAPVATPVAHAKPQPALIETPKPDPNAELAARVRRALDEEAKVTAGAIDISATDGIVTLWGTTGTADERQRAETVATQVDGVKSVENKLVVVRGS